MNAVEWLENQGLAVEKVEKLDGLTACSRLIYLENGRRLVWREQSLRATDYGVNYRQEAALLSTLHFLPFSPKPYFSTDDFSLLEWLDGTVPQAFSDRLLQKLATHLATLHSLDLQAVKFAEKTAKLDLAERCRFLWSKLNIEQQAALNFAPPFEPITPFMQAVCHHDVHLGNLVEQNEELFLIDWEYATISDPALELALFLHANPLSCEQQAVFFAAYFAKFHGERTACLAKMQEYQPLVQKLTELWYAIYSDNM